MSSVTVVDYGIGNLLSVTRAFAALGADVNLTNDHAAIAAADRLVLPGVGAFGDGIHGLRQRNLIEPLTGFAAKGRPFLGICLGMQLMLDTGEEFGEHTGLGLVAGRVIKIPSTGTNGQPHKIPHIGWNTLRPGGRNSWDGTILQGLPEQSSCYFVHSFMARTDVAGESLAECDYNGREITAVLAKDHIYGCQFHPEKSGRIGLRILQNFLVL
jgi:glutamine amidotransferase